MISSIRLFVLATGLVCVLFRPSAEAAVHTWSAVSAADAFVAAGSAGNPLGADLSANNYGGAGALMIAPADATKGEFQSLLKFDLSGALADFDAQFGVGGWQITSITLRLAGNFAVQDATPNNGIFNTINGGGFAIEWLSDDSWTEGSGNPSSPTLTDVNFASLPALLTAPREILGSFTYVPPGNNVTSTWNLALTSGFLADAAGGGLLSFRLFSDETGGASYLFNSRSFGTAGNRPLLSVTAIPEPGTVGLLVAGMTLLAARLWRRR